MLPLSSLLPVTLSHSFLVIAIVISILLFIFIIPIAYSEYRHFSKRNAIINTLMFCAGILLLPSIPVASSYWESNNLRSVLATPGVRLTSFEYGYRLVSPRPGTVILVSDTASLPPNILYTLSTDQAIKLSRILKTHKSPTVLGLSNLAKPKSIR